MMKFIDRDRIPTDHRPLGYWIRAIDGPLRNSMRETFAAFGVSRREWRTLTTLHAGPASAEEVEAALPLRRGHRTLEQLLDGFIARGWAALDRGSYALTAEGERVHDAVLTNVQTVRATVTAGIPEADYVTTMTTLEQIAKNVGWDPENRPAHPRHGGPGHGGRGHGGRGRGRGPQRGHDPKRGLA